MKKTIILLLILTGCVSAPPVNHLKPDNSLYNVFCSIDGMPIGDEEVKIIEIGLAHYRVQTSENREILVPISNCVLEKLVPLAPFNPEDWHY